MKENSNQKSKLEAEENSKTLDQRRGSEFETEEQAQEGR